ncbi:MAG TPA: hypothetical protein VGE34_03455 [Candidatus Saccharimonadales bacterium]
MSDNLQKNALLSVYDKSGIDTFGRELENLGWTIYASGGTAKALTDAGITVIDAAELIGGAAILGHKVVTLSREIHAGLMADLDDPSEVEELSTLGIPEIHLVAVDFYPLEEEINNPASTPESIREKTDIGGPTMLRSAAKGRRIVLSRPEQRSEVIEWLKNDRPDNKLFREKLAAVAEYECARYIGISAGQLGGADVFTMNLRNHAELKYGENPYQSPSALFADNRIAPDPLGMDQFVQHKGHTLSYINMTDLDRLVNSITHIAAGFEKNFGTVPCIAIGAKHSNACGAAVADTPVKAVEKMLEGDLRAIFGGVIIMNFVVDEEVATSLMRHKVEGEKNRLLDAVIAGDITPEALEILSRAKLRVLTNPALLTLTEASLEHAAKLRPVRGGMLINPQPNFVLDLASSEITGTGDLSEQQKRDIVLSWGIGSTSQSNTITIVKDDMLYGNGVGQQDRVGAAQLALKRAGDAGHDVSDATAYSDSFFPFVDGPATLVEAGIGTIFATSGSIRDQEVLDYLADKSVTMRMIPDKIGRGFYGH